MNITTTKAHPQGKGRPQTVRYQITGTGASGPRLPEELDTVSISSSASDGADASTSSRAFVTFGLDDDPDKLDALIGKLTDLRARQRQLRGAR